MSLRECAGCAELLGLLLNGWRVPPEDYEPMVAFGQDGEARRSARWERLRYWSTRVEADRLPTVGEGVGARPIHPSQDRETWANALESAGMDPGNVARNLDIYFPEPEDGRGKKRLHRWITPKVVARMVAQVEAALEHLQELPVGEIADHFTEVYGETWPPHLEAIHDFIVDRWPEGYRGKGTALRVAIKLPFTTYTSLAPLDPNAPPVSVTHYPCTLTYKQLRPMLERAE